MNKVNLIFICLIFIFAIGCASAAAVPSNSSDLSFANAVEQVSCDESIQLQENTQIVSDENNNIGAVESESSSNLKHSHSMEDKKLGSIIKPNIMPTPFNNDGSKNNGQNKTINTDVKKNVTASFF